MTVNIEKLKELSKVGGMFPENYRVFIRESKEMYNIDPRLFFAISRTIEKEMKSDKLYRRVDGKIYTIDKKEVEYIAYTIDFSDLKMPLSRIVKMKEAEHVDPVKVCHFIIEDGGTVGNWKNKINHETI